MTDLTEESFNELVKQIKASFTEYKITPTRYIVPAWVLKEIEEQYGAPATEEKYHKWNMKRLGLSELTYRRILTK